MGRDHWRRFTRLHCVVGEASASAARPCNVNLERSWASVTTGMNKYFRYSSDETLILKMHCTIADNGHAITTKLPRRPSCPCVHSAEIIIGAKFSQYVVKAIPPYNWNTHNVKSWRNCNIVDPMFSVSTITKLVRDSGESQYLAAPRLETCRCSWEQFSAHQTRSEWVKAPCASKIHASTAQYVLWFAEYEFQTM